MLLFIHGRYIIQHFLIVISKHRMLLFIMTASNFGIKTDQFQNIVCYCLSRHIKPPSSLSHRFQNIVCYCLSESATGLYRSSLYFKTSYVTVYRNRSIEKILFLNDFKTSYVTVYQGIGTRLAGAFQILKHRMLLFIKDAGAQIADDLKFQNIVCYCLSIRIEKINVR